MIQLADTVVLVSSINPQNEHHQVAKKYLDLVGRDKETFVPLVNLIEFDLVMKGRNYTSNQRRDSFNWLSLFVPEEKTISNSVGSFEVAARLQEAGLGYFDSLVSAIAIEKDAIVLTTDQMISKVAKTKW